MGESENIKSILYFDDWIWDGNDSLHPWRRIAIEKA